jgi:nitrite reductase/ring-hydroxylating ferredoxin subunit
MKKYFLLIITSLFFLGCSDNGNSNKNPYLGNYTFSVDLNLNLPTYSPLKYVSNPIYYPGVGVSGIIVMYTGSTYTAFDAACPNQQEGSCAAMTIKGVNAVCSCDKKEYNLFTGQGEPYPLKQYRVQVINETLIRISN